MIQSKMVIEGHSLFTGRLGNALLHGLQVAAVAVVAQAVVSMRCTLASDLPRLILALLAAATRHTPQTDSAR